MAPRLRPLLTPPNDGTQKGNKLDLRLALKKGAGQGDVMRVTGTFSGALPLLACGQFTPGYFQLEEKVRNTPQLSSNSNIPEREAEPRILLRCKRALRLVDFQVSVAQ